jgi:hypothetical protein
MRGTLTGTVIDINIDKDEMDFYRCQLIMMTPNKEFPGLILKTRCIFYNPFGQNFGPSLECIIYKFNQPNYDKPIKIKVHGTIHQLDHGFPELQVEWCVMDVDWIETKWFGSTSKVMADSYYLKQDRIQSGVEQSVQ